MPAAVVNGKALMMMALVLVMWGEEMGKCAGTLLIMTMMGLLIVPIQRAFRILSAALFLSRWYIQLFHDPFIGKSTLKRFDKIIAITKWELPYLSKLGVPKDKMVGYFVVVLIAAIVVYVIIGVVVGGIAFSGYALSRSTF